MSRAARILRGYAHSILAFRDEPELLAEALQIIAAGEAALGRNVVFRYLGEDATGRDLFEIGRDGEPPRSVATHLRGVWWVWAAIDDAGRSEVLRAIDFAAPDASEPEGSTRKAIRTTAAQWLGRHLPELETAALSINITEGFIRYEAPASAPRIITR